MGSVITSDIISMTDAELGTGVGGCKYALVVRSLFGKGFQMFYQMKRQQTEDVDWALKHFIGNLSVDLLYTDDAPQYNRLSRLLGLPWDKVQLHRGGSRWDLGGCHSSL